MGTGQPAGKSGGLDDAGPVSTLDSPRRQSTRSETMAAFAEIKNEVDTLAEAAERIGMTQSALQAALERSRKDGDPRAQWRGLGWRQGRRPTLVAMLEAWKSFPAGLSRPEAAARLGTTTNALNCAIRNGRLSGLLDDLEPWTPEEAYEEITFLTDQGVSWEDALKRVVPNRTPLSRAVRDLRRSA